MDRTRRGPGQLLVQDTLGERGKVAAGRPRQVERARPLHQVGHHPIVAGQELCGLLLMDTSRRRSSTLLARRQLAPGDGQLCLRPVATGCARLAP